jgi:hypothetical protein
LTVLRKKASKFIALLLAAAAASALISCPPAYALSSSDEYYGYQWALKNDGSFDPANYGLEASGSTAAAGIDIDIENAWSAYTPKRSAVVAVIDTGADTSRSDLSGRLWVNSDEKPGNGVDDDGNGYVDDVNGWNFRDGSNVLHTAGQDDHGTFCFGTIAAACNSDGIAGICGYSSKVSVMVLKAFGTTTGRTGDIIKAIGYAEANGASIVNLSLGITEYNQALYLAIKNSKMLFVCACGNSGSDTSASPMYPAAYDLPNIISVANLSYDGKLNSYSNYGSSVDIAAPGTSVVGYAADNRLVFMTGTSMSTPMVSGVAALLYSGTSRLSLSDVRSIILNTASPLASLRGKVNTGGMLDAGAALQSAMTLDGQKKSVFSDVNTGDWFYSYVTDLANAGIVAGYGDGTFRPANSVTVGEALALIIKSSGYGDQPATGSHWASGYRDKALAIGAVGASDVQDLNAPASRLFIALTAAKALGLTPAAGASPFADIDDPYVTALYNAGIISGSFNSAGVRVFLPQSNVKRSEMSAIVWQMIH